jgi:hypothetical protein
MLLFNLQLRKTEKKMRIQIRNIAEQKRIQISLVEICTEKSTSMGSGNL